jgi:hypothetical protein
MSFHFLNGNTYGPHVDTGPGTIVVDPLATIQTTGAASALTLSAGPWDITVNGASATETGYGINLADAGAFRSTIKLGIDAVIQSTTTTRSTPHTSWTSPTPAESKARSLASKRMLRAITA